MRIRSQDLPQADRIESVVAATVAVAQGATTDIEIANAVPRIEDDDRQGRYYRSAAEILGFITNRRNFAQITERGLQIAANPVLTNPTLVASVVNLNIYQKLLPFIELHPQGVSRQQIMDYLQTIADPGMGRTMIPRRISTVIAWIRTLGIITEANDLFHISGAILPVMPIISFNDIDQPILPATGSLQEYQQVEERMSNAGGMITVYRDQARVERANIAHRGLVNLVASRIRNAGGIPKSNQFIDLATALDGDFIFEMKSTTDTNVIAQVRKGVSQLYEYRYLENKPDASLILVIENPLMGDSVWLQEYLENDRDIHLVWDGDDLLHGSGNTRDALPFLGLV